MKTSAEMLLLDLTAEKIENMTLSADEIKSLKS